MASIVSFRLWQWNRANDLALPRNTQADTCLRRFPPAFPFPLTFLQGATSFC